MPALISDIADLAALQTLLSDIKSDAWQVIHVPRSGTGSARLYILRCLPHTVAAKIYPHAHREAYNSELRGYNFLCGNDFPFLPKLYYYGSLGDEKCTITECINIYSLHGETLIGTRKVEDLRLQYIKTFSAIGDLWAATRREVGSIDKEQHVNSVTARIERIQIGLDRSTLSNRLASEASRYITECGMRIVKRGHARLCVSCHGDPHVANIFLGSNQRVAFIDWDKSEDGLDWRKSIAHMLGWIFLRYSSVVKKRSFNNHSNYAIKEPKMFLYLWDYIDAWLRNGMHYALDDIKAINDYLFLQYVGDGRFAEAWGRSELADYYLANAVDWYRVCRARRGLSKRKAGFLNEP